MIKIFFKLLFFSVIIHLYYPNIVYSNSCRSNCIDNYSICKRRCFPKDKNCIENCAINYYSCLENCKDIEKYDDKKDTEFLFEKMKELKSTPTHHKEEIIIKNYNLPRRYYDEEKINPNNNYFDTQNSMYDKRIKTEEDIDKDTDINLLINLSNKGNLEAQYWLGYKYYWGYGVEKNYKEAEKWLIGPARNGDISAQNILKKIKNTNR